MLETLQDCEENSNLISSTSVMIDQTLKRVNNVVDTADVTAEQRVYAL